MGHTDTETGRVKETGFAEGTRMQRMEKHLLALAMRRELCWGAACLRGDVSAGLSYSFFFTHFEAKQYFGISSTHF